MPLNFRVLSRVSRVILFLFLLVFSAQAQTPYYHINRTFTPVDINLEGVPTLEELNAAADKLTDTVPGAIKPDTNETYAIEKQAAIAIGYGSAISAWNAAAAYNGTPSNYPGKTFDNVGWVRGTINSEGQWGAYLWVLQNRIAFQASTSAWWSTTNGIPVAISNVMVGSLGDYQATSNVVDIGPVIPSNFPGANQNDSGTYQVDISNVFYRLIIPDIWITPRDAVVGVGGSNVQYSVAGTNIPQGVTWTLIPDGLTSGAVIQASNDWHYAGVTPGDIATNYTIRATSVDNTNFYDEVSLAVIKVELAPANRIGCPHCLNNLVYSLTNSFVPNGVTWSISPSGLSGGATVTPNGNQVAVSAGTVGTNYTIRATSVDSTNCYGEAGLTVYVPGNITQTGNSYDDTTNTNESHKVIYHQFSPTPQGDAAAQHFCFVQTLQGYMRQADGTNYFLVQMYGTLVDFNFTNSQIDSWDNDPAYGSPPHYGHQAEGLNVYDVVDNPHPGDYDVGVKCDVSFAIGLYCTNGVPSSGAASQPAIGTSFDTKTWDYRVTVTTNAAGAKVFTHP